MIKSRNHTTPLTFLSESILEVLVMQALPLTRCERVQDWRHAIWTRLCIIQVSCILLWFGDRFQNMHFWLGVFLKPCYADTTIDTLCTDTGLEASDSNLKLRLCLAFCYDLKIGFRNKRVNKHLLESTMPFSVTPAVFAWCEVCHHCLTPSIVLNRNVLFVLSWC